MVKLANEKRLLAKHNPDTTIMQMMINIQYYMYYILNVFQVRR